MGEWDLKPGVRAGAVPLLIGVAGPSGSGKTYSALRLATGMREVLGGDIAVIDSEADRALHYAPAPGTRPQPPESFDFRHVSFAPPFGARRYLEAIRAVYEQGARIIIVDSMSHEHEGEGGLLDYHEEEWQRLSGGEGKHDERKKMLAWAKPKAARRDLILGILQLKANIVFCFRAKQGVRPVKRQGGRTEYEQQGFSPISGEEILFETTVCCVLPPKSGGVPQWESEYAGERLYMKLPRQFKAIFAASKPLDEAIGRELATWAKGGEVSGQGAGGQRASTEDAGGSTAAGAPPPVSRDELVAAVHRAARRLDVQQIRVNEWLRARVEEMGASSTRELGPARLAELIDQVETLTEL